MTSRSPRRWLAPITIGAANVVAQIAVPSAVIGAYALFAASAERVVAFAGEIAEPTALTASVATTALGAAWVARGRAHVPFGGSVTGLVAAAFVAAAALWAGDVDLWTGTAVVLLPFAGALGTWLTRPRERQVRREPAPIRALSHEEARQLPDLREEAFVRRRQREES